MTLVALILAGVWVLLSYQRGEVKSPFEATPTPTRVAESWFQEARAYFDSGKLDDPSNNPVTGTPAITSTPTPTRSPDTTLTPLPTITPTPAVNDAIDAYQAALRQDPKNTRAWTELARIQTYSSSMLRNDQERFARMEAALKSADQAVALTPDDSNARAIRAFVLDWYADSSLHTAARQEELLGEANNEAVIAYNLDHDNALALAFYAEILADQQKWLQAEKYAAQAVNKGPDLMDTHRVYAYVLESLAQYNAAIQQYQKAAEIAPNLTFLYIRIGVNFREAIHNPDRALEYFDKAASINRSLGVQNPLPYIEIAKTYTQLGQFFVAARNAEKALEFDSSNAPTYGQLGIVFIKARNYEGAMPLLKCAVKGCKAAENEMGRADVQGLALSNLSVAYYYVEYGTVLAFLSRPNENYCPEALPVLDQVRKAYPDDPFLKGIVEDSEGLCRRVAGGYDTPTAAPTLGLTGTPPTRPAPSRTPIPTPTRKATPTVSR
jgi:tetratricopeptide (TPR) repeat protein